MTHEQICRLVSPSARLALLVLAAAFATAAHAVTIPTVPVGNAGNAGEVQSQGTFGAVAYDYRIGTTEVTTVPEPSTAVLAIVGCVLMLWWRKRRK